MICIECKQEGEAYKGRNQCKECYKKGRREYWRKKKEANKQWGILSKAW